MTAGGLLPQAKIQEYRRPRRPGPGLLGISLGLNHHVVNDKKSIVNDYVAAEQQFCNKLNFIHDKYTRVLQYSSTLSKPANRVTNQEIVKKLGTRS